VVDELGAKVNKRLVELMRERFQLGTHLRALKKFLLLGQGDFVTLLMDMLGPVSSDDGCWNEFTIRLCSAGDCSREKRSANSREGSRG
jgi:hypothetical protein